MAAGERRELLKQEASLLLQVHGARHDIHAGGGVRVHRVDCFLVFLVFLHGMQGPGLGLVLAVCSVAAAAAAKAGHGKARGAAVAERAAAMGVRGGAIPRAGAAKLRPAKAAGCRQLLRRRDTCRQSRSPSTRSSLDERPCSWQLRNPQWAQRQAGNQQADCHPCAAPGPPPKRAASVHAGSGHARPTCGIGLRQQQRCRALEAGVRILCHQVRPRHRQPQPQ